MPTAANTLLVGSSVLNSVLLLTLLAWQQTEHTVSDLATRRADPTWCQPRPAALVGGEDDHSPPPSPAAVSSSAVEQHIASPGSDAVLALATGEAAATDRESSWSASEQRLKRVWWHPPHASWKEQHDARWTFLNERQLARGLVNAGDPQRLRCLADKLLAGRLSRLSVLGGSVSFGTTFTTGKSRALYHWKMYQYLNASFPRAAHEHFQGAVPASGPSYMEHCIEWHLPPGGPDLILLEYAVNFDEMPDDAACFERLLRKLLRLPQQPAIIIINTMEIVPPGGRLPWEHGEATSYPSAQDLSFTWRGHGATTGAEDAINDVAAYYSVPCVSLRGALFAELKANASAFPIKTVFHDRHHPSAWGHSLMAQMAAKLVEQAIDHQAKLVPPPQLSADGRVASAACAAALNEAPVPWAHGGRALLPPIYAEGDQAPVGVCLKDTALRDRLQPTSAVGFRYLVEGRDAKMKPGIVGQAAGDVARFCLDISRLNRGAPFVLLLGHLISYEHMGVARISCVDDCECEAVDIDAHVPGGRFSVFKAKTINARRRSTVAAVRGDDACGCKVEVRILEQTRSGEHKFKVLSLMTAMKEGSLRYGHQAGFNNRPTEARFT